MISAFYRGVGGARAQGREMTCVLGQGTAGAGLESRAPDT